VRILFVENHETFARTVTESFLPDQDVVLVGTLAEARRVLAASQDFDAVLVDYDLPDGKGTAILAHLQARRFRGRIVAVSSHQDGNRTLVASGAHATCAKQDFRRIREVLSLPARWP
jgi:DNA-binding NarL/FixJ family response regulator